MKQIEQMTTATRLYDSIKGLTEGLVEMETKLDWAVRQIVFDTDPHGSLLVVVVYERNR